MTTNHGERPGVEPADVFDGPMLLYPVAALIGDEACESCGAKVDATGFAFDIGGGCAYACAACAARSIAAGEAAIQYIEREEAFLVFHDVRSGDSWWEVHTADGCLMAASRVGETPAALVARVRARYPGRFDFVESYDSRAYGVTL